MLLLIITFLLFIVLFSKSSSINSPPDCRFLNSIDDHSAKIKLLEYHDNYNDKNTSFIFEEINYFQPQCLLCEKLERQICFGYNGGTTYGIPSGTIKTVELITNLPYLYSLGNYIGSKITLISVIFTLRENLVIPYRTLLRFKGITTQDPVVNDKSVFLRFFIICMPNDTRQYSLTIVGRIDKLHVYVLVNKMLRNNRFSYLIFGYRRVQINCENQKINDKLVSLYPDESICSSGSCLGSEYCLTYQPDYAITRETWCPLTENNWMLISDNSLKLSLSDSFLPLHIQIERILLHEKPFSLILNPQWFIDYIGVLTLSIPEVTSDYYSDPIWKIALPSTGQHPLNQRIILLYNCINVQIRYNIIDKDYFQTTIVFIDMKTNSTFTIKNNSDEVKQLCNPEIFVPTNYSGLTTIKFETRTTKLSNQNIFKSTTKQNQTQKMTQIIKNVDNSTQWESIGFGQLIQPSFALMIYSFILLFSYKLL